MSIFIPYNPDAETTGNPIIPHPDFVSAGEQLRVKATGSYAGATSVTKTADATLVAAPSADLIPGSATPSSWAATATPADTTGSNPLVADMRVAIGSFIEAPVTATESNAIEVSVIADHVNGVDRVEFIANDGTPFSVSSEAQRNWGSLDSDLPNSPCYTATLNLAVQTAGAPVEIRAIIYPTHGTPLVLQGNGTNNAAQWDPDGKVYEGTNSVFFTKVSEVVDVTVSTSDGLRDAIAAQTFNSTKQYRFMLTQSLSSWAAGNDPSFTANPYIPIIVRGSLADRAVSTFDINCPTNNPPTVAQPKTLNGVNSDGGIFWQYENLSIYQGTTAFLHNAGNGAIIRDCIITREAELVTSFKGEDISANNPGGSWTEGNSVKSMVASTRYSRDQPNFDSTSDAVICIKDSVVTTTPALIGNGTYLLESTVEHNSNIGNGVVLQRNNVHQANLQDVSSAQTNLNLLVRDSAFGAEVPFTVGGNTRVWNVPVEGDFDSSVVEVGTVPLNDPAPDGANIPYLAQDTNPDASVPSPNWSVYKKYYTAAAVDTNGNVVPSRISYGRLDPHVDIWQPPVSPPTLGPGSSTPTNTTGWYTINNTIIQGVYATDVLLQPFIDTQWGSSYSSVVHNGTVFKDWVFEGEQVVASTTKSRTYNSMYNYLWRNMDFNPAGTQQYMGQFIFQQDLDGDPNYDNLTGDTDPSLLGSYLDMTIIDSNLGNFDATVDSSMSQGDTLATWVANEVDGSDSTVRLAGTTTGIYGLAKPSGGITISGLASEGSSLAAVTSISNAETETLQWSRADTELGTYTDISGATGSSYVTGSSDLGKYIKCTVTAIGLPPTLIADSNIIGPIGAGVLELGGFTKVYKNNSIAQVLHKITDDNGRTGTWGQQGRGGTLGWNDTTMYIGPGMVDGDTASQATNAAGDPLASSSTGVYLSPTYQYTGRSFKDVTTMWRDKTPNNLAGQVQYRLTVTQPDGTVIVDEPGRDITTFGNQGGYIGLQASGTGWTPSFDASTTLPPIQANATVRIDFYFVPADESTTIAGTFTGPSATGGATDVSNVSSTPSVTGLASVIARGTSGSSYFQLVFNSAADRDAFVAEYPNGSTATLEYEGVTYTATNSSWASAGNNVARLASASFDAFPVAFVSGNDYSIKIDK